MKASEKRISTQFQLLAKALHQASAQERRTLLTQWRGNQALADVENAFVEDYETDSQVHASHLLLDSLYFEEMDDRQDAVTEAHVTTLQWIFQEQPAESKSWTDFVTWLSQENQPDSLYWITGKPGSGKSTLMKFLFSDQRTKKYSRQWAKPCKLIMATHFFWHAGDYIQKSTEGLLRSLLYQIFSEVPEVIEIACPSRFSSYRSGALRLGLWTDRQLLKALYLALTKLCSDWRACIFIDGLDEFEGDKAARSGLIELVKNLSRFPNVKMCVSSRPWVIFKSAFERGSSLELHHFTHRDIKNYVDQELTNAESFARLKNHDSAVCSELVLEIVEKAQGVFLWVHLVVRDLLECLQNRDSIKDLHRRLRSMPSDLNEFYFDMLNRLDEFYYEQAYKSLQVATVAGHPISLLAYSYILEGEKHDPVSMRIDFMADRKIDYRCEDTAVRLNSRCRGLLEVVTTHRGYIDFQKRVDFLHRTVKDFFEQGALEQMLKRLRRLKQFDETWDVNEALAGSYLAQLKTVDFDPRNLGHTKYMVDELFEAARRYEEYNSKGLIQILDDLDRTGTMLLNYESTLRYGEHWMTFIDDCSEHYGLPGSDNTFFTAALRRQLWKYCGIKLQQCPSLLSEEPGRPLLDCILRPKGMIHLDLMHGVERGIGILLWLLQNGADPNMRVPRSTIWGRWLYYIQEFHFAKKPTPAHLVHPTRLLIAHGARRKVILPGSPSRRSARDIIQKAFGTEVTNDLDKCFIRPKLNIKLFQYSSWRKKRASQLSAQCLVPTATA